MLWDCKSNSLECNFSLYIKIHGDTMTTWGLSSLQEELTINRINIFWNLHPLLGYKLYWIIVKNIQVEAQSSSLNRRQSNVFRNWESSQCKTSLFNLSFYLSEHLFRHTEQRSKNSLSVCLIPIWGKKHSKLFYSKHWYSMWSLEMLWFICFFLTFRF